MSAALTKKHLRLILLAIVCLAAGLRLFNHWQQSARNPVYAFPLVDAKEYVDDARYYLDVDFLGPPGSYFHPPFYSYFIALAFEALGSDPAVIKWLQMGLDLLNLWLLFLIGKRVFSYRTALVAAFLYAVSIPVIQFSSEILPPILLIFLLLLSVYGLLRFTDDPRNSPPRLRWLVLAAVSLGCLVITLPNFLLALPVVAVWLVWVFRETAVKKRLLYILVLCIALVPVGLTAARNHFFAGENVLINHAGGINFYIGNNPDVKRTVSIRPGLEWERFLMEAYEREEIKDYRSQNAYWIHRAFKFIGENPLRWIGLLGKKMVLFYNAHGFPRNFDTGYFSRYSLVLQLPILRLHTILPLFFLGVLLIVIGRLKALRGDGLGLILSLILVYSFSIAMIFVAGRYRLPVLPLMILIAAAGVVAVYHAVRERRWLLVGLQAAFSGAVAVLVSLAPFASSYPYDIAKSHTEAMIAGALYDHSRYNEAQAYFERALSGPKDESTYEAYSDYAKYWSKRGDTDKAIENFRKSLSLNPDNHEALNGLGFYHKMRKDYDQAKEYLTRGVEAAPCYPQMYLNLADCHLAQGEIAEAIKVVESYYIRCPSPHPTIAFNLAKLLMDKAQDWKNAARYLKLAIRYPQGLPTSAETFNRLGACYYYMKMPAEAESAWREGLKIDPDNRAIQTNLSVLRSGKTGE